MTNANFSLGDIHENIRMYADMYIKRVIINTKLRYLKNQGRAWKYGFTFESLEAMEIADPSDLYEKIPWTYFESRGMRIPVYDPLLASALSSLTMVQRDVLLQNVVLGIPLSAVANDLGLSKRMVEKHKQNALQKLRKEMVEQ